MEIGLKINQCSLPALELLKELKELLKPLQAPSLRKAPAGKKR
ncbi:MAG TPA: hypothetical protein VI894_02935 [Candidatus Nanoarchaeia archaeon]|nr:hypothetical protein [Candidatus Nanoarchaeia archaeon]